MGIEKIRKGELDNFRHIILDQLFAHSLCILNNATFSGSTITTQKKL